jgi:hypothetical protein
MHEGQVMLRDTGETMSLQVSCAPISRICAPEWKDQNQKTRFENDWTGYRVIPPVGSGTGEQGGIVAIDDPTDGRGRIGRRARNSQWLVERCFNRWGEVDLIS